MKTSFVVVAVLFCLTVSVSVSAQVAGVRQACHRGNIEVKGGESLRYLQSQTCVDGSVMIHGLDMVDDDVFEELDFGKLRIVTGFVYVTGCPRLKFIKSNLRRAFYLSIWNNPMLDRCRIELFALRAGMGGRYDASLSDQGCGLIQSEREELEMLREYYGIY